MGNQNQKREGTKKKRKDKKKKHHAYALIVLILAAAIIILGTVLLFYIQEVEVSGNEYCDSQEIVECVQNDKLSKNSLYVLAKYSLGQGKKPECLDTLKEKTRVGCVKSGKKYSYFDQTKLVVNETEVKDSKIPVVSGLKIKKNKLYSQIKTTNQTKFSEIVEACGESQRYGIYPEKIYVKDQQIYMDFGNVRACLGNQVSAEQIAQIRPILKKLGDKTGILHLESYSENNTTITFEMEDISQEN